MDEQKLLVELTEKINARKEMLLVNLKALDIAELGREVWRQQFKDIYNRVLSENDFRASMDCKRGDKTVSTGDRILSEEFDFLMSEEDFNRYQSLILPYCAEEGLTDEKGYYIKNWDSIVCDARRELVDFIIDKIVPDSMREIFSENRRNIVKMDKLIDILRNCVSAS